MPSLPGSKYDLIFIKETSKIPISVKSHLKSRTRFGHNSDLLFISRWKSIPVPLQFVVYIRKLKSTIFPFVAIVTVLIPVNLKYSLTNCIIKFSRVVRRKQIQSQNWALLLFACWVLFMFLFVCWLFSHPTLSKIYFQNIQKTMNILTDTTIIF